MSGFVQVAFVYWAILLRCMSVVLSEVLKLQVAKWKELVLYYTFFLNYSFSFKENALAASFKNITINEFLFQGISGGSKCFINLFLNNRQFRVRKHLENISCRFSVATVADAHGYRSV